MTTKKKAKLVKPEAHSYRSVIRRYNQLTKRIDHLEAYLENMEDYLRQMSERMGELQHRCDQMGQLKARVGDIWDRIVKNPSKPKEGVLCDLCRGTGTIMVPTEFGYGIKLCPNGCKTPVYC